MWWIVRWRDIDGRPQIRPFRSKYEAYTFSDIVGGHVERWRAEL